jgi:hypothetical protein
VRRGPFLNLPGLWVAASIEVDAGVGYALFLDEAQHEANPVKPAG